jgi:AcrR family transcriptional regulator
VKRPSGRSRGVGAPDDTQPSRRQSRPVALKPVTGPRISRHEREQMIVREAVGFFAEQGFEGQTRELARRLGVTQPLLYRYFPDKATLIDRVYREVFLDRWRPQWQAWIVDASRPLPERLIRFYQDYARLILSYEWVRLFMFSGLKGLDIAKHYAEMIFARVYPSVIGEMRAAEGCQSLAEHPMTDGEAEHLWALHAAIFYLGIRRWVYRLPVPEDQDAAVAARVRAFLDGAPAVMHAAAASAGGRSQLVEAMMRPGESGAGWSLMDPLSLD